jgi:predicted small secreted protein
MKPSFALVGLLLLLASFVLSACPGKNTERGSGNMGGGMQPRSSRY